MVQETVSIGPCYSLAEAMMIRSLLGARGIEAIIPGLGSGSSIVAHASGFTSKVLVLREHAEEATALITSLREGHPGDGDGEHAEADLTHDASDGAELQAEPASELALEALRARQRRVVRTVVAGLILPLGGAHLANGAYGRTLLLAALQVLACWSLVHGHKSSLFLCILVLTVDLIGGVLVARAFTPAPNRTELPDARIVPRKR